MHVSSSPVYKLMFYLTIVKKKKKNNNNMTSLSLLCERTVYIHADKRPGSQKSDEGQIL